jgi:hypothetical protein
MKTLLLQNENILFYHARVEAGEEQTSSGAQERLTVVSTGFLTGLRSTLLWHSKEAHPS